MYFGKQEIKSIKGNVVTFMDGQVIEIEELNKELFTKEPISGSDLQMNWAAHVAKQIIDIYHANNIRLTDINLINQLVNDIVTGKNDEAIASAFGKEKLDTLTSIYGGEEKLASLAARNIRLKDIFKS